ncbi:MAG: SpoIIE family protein phosphatase [Spirochaetota bacterium]|jgi:hypothetical protein|nr:SpoIIE family protein phosphatase [Spirochaetota bacterium]
MKTTQKTRSLRTKLTLYPAIIFIAVGLVGTLINLQIANSLFSSLGEKYTSEILKAKISEFGQTFDRNIDTSRYMSENSIMREWMKAEDNRVLRDASIDNLQKLEILLKKTDTFVALDNSKSLYENGIFLNTLARDIPSDSWYWQVSATKDMTVDISYNAQLLATKLYVYAPVWEGNRLLGVTGTGLDVSEMITQMVAKVSEGAHVILFNELGHVKAHINSDYIDNRTIFHLVGSDGDRVRSAMKKLDTLPKTSESIISEFITYEGKSYMGSFSSIDLRSATWYILVLMDVNALLLSIFIPFIGMLIISLLLILASLVILISRVVLKPLDVIDSNLAKIMERDFTVYIDLATGDEFTMVANTINMMTANIREYTENLEGLVAQRTKQLQEAFEEVNALKVQQDGDYFLTSLLINPLVIRDVQSDLVSVDFYVKQKKKFTFKTHYGEIGGDLCIAREIVLSDKRYLAFTNADAMGKSLQGAGGALVFGVVFNSYINRTPLFPSIYMAKPETWISEIYEELHRVFVSFEGSMLMSAVIGLIDEETGAMYYLNAEHPWTVCYRDGKASFTEEELTMRKIGTVGFDTGIVISTLQLKSQDVIFLGSDGRDDIMMGMNEETGQRIINEDETLFLRSIENADGDLEKTAEAIAGSGDLTDDFTIVRIAWLKSPVSRPPDYEAVRSSGYKAIQDKDLPRAIQLLRKTMYLYPEPEVIERLAACHRERGETMEIIQTYQYGLKHLPLNETLLYDMVNECRRMVRELLENTKNKEESGKASSYIRLALDYGERLLIINPQHFKVILHVADCYRMVRRYADARVLLERAKKIMPDDDNLKAIERMLERDEAQAGKTNN